MFLKNINQKTLTKRSNMKNWIQLLILAVISLFSFNSLQGEEGQSTNKDRPVVVVKTTQGSFEVTLFPDIAPKAVENFLKHAEDHYYDGTTFHRVIRGFMIQGGDPLGNGTGGVSIWGKPFEDEVRADVKFDKAGYLAMANSGPKTNGSQFFITTAQAKWLNQKHTIFGQVTKGYDIVQKIEATPTGRQDKPLEKQEIISITLKE